MKHGPGNSAGWWLRLALGAAALGVIIWLIHPAEILAAVAGANGIALSLAALLLVPNVWFQFYKWRYVLRAGGYIFPDAVVWQSLFYGFAFGIVTPARLGEFGGRMVAHRSLQNSSAPGLVAADKFAAMIVTIVFGLVAVAAWGLHFEWFTLVPALGIACLAAAVPFIAWQAVRFADARMERRPPSNFITRAIHTFSAATRLLTPQQYRAMLLYSTGFYFTFVAQFTILLLAFGEVSVLYAALGVGCVMIAKTIVPPVTLGELGIREGFAVFFLTMIGLSPAAAFSASLLLFVLNILAPSAVGGVLLLRSAIQPRMQE